MADVGGPYDFVYVHTDIPEGMTIREWRAERATLRGAGRRTRRERRPAALIRWVRRLLAEFALRSTAVPCPDVHRGVR
jgi:hypothetical protein